MSTTEVPGNATSDTSVGRVDMKLETVVIPVSDVDRAKAFYESLGWRLDADLGNDDLPGRPAHAAGLRVLDPVRHGPHLGCARLGAGLSSSSPTSRRRTTSSSAHGVDASEVFHDASGGYNRFDPEARASGPDPRTADVRVVRRRSATRTATAGSCRRSPTDCPAASTRRRRRSAPPAELARRTQAGRGRARRAREAHG